MPRLQSFAAAYEPFTAALRVSAIGPFLALVPDTAADALEQLAAQCVQEFDRFRAPIAAGDRARRLASTLTARQTKLLDLWGYPYVFEEFGFHMTLSSKLDEPQRRPFRRVLEELYAPIAQPFIVDGLAIYHQADPAHRFCVLERFPFGRARTPSPDNLDRV